MNFIRPRSAMASRLRPGQAPETTGRPVFVPDPDRVARAPMTGFIRYCEARTRLRFPDAAAFHRFSVEHYRRFWRLFLSWSALPCSGSPDPVCVGDDCETATFFPDLRLSFVEALLGGDGDGDGDAGQPALIACHADRPADRLTRGQLRRRVARLARA